VLIGRRRSHSRESSRRRTRRPRTGTARVWNELPRPLCLSMHVHHIPTQPRGSHHALPLVLCPSETAVASSTGGPVAAALTCSGRSTIVRSGVLASTTGAVGFECTSRSSLSRPMCACAICSADVTPPMIVPMSTDRTKSGFGSLSTRALGIDSQPAEI
jgi:hypothetical protein